MSIPLLGHHNIRNATAAIAAALCIGIPIKTIKEGLLGFKGVQRRFNKLFEFKGRNTLMIMHIIQVKLRKF